MLKRFMFMLVALLLTVSSALAQAIAPRCRVCGRKLTECPYKGMPSGKLPDDIFRFSKLLHIIVIGQILTNESKVKNFYSELANYLRNTRYNCQYPLHIVLYSNQDVKRYKKVFNDKRKFYISKRH